MVLQFCTPGLVRLSTLLTGRGPLLTPSARTPQITEKVSDTTRFEPGEFLESLFLFKERRDAYKLRTLISLEAEFGQDKRVLNLMISLLPLLATFI